MSVNGLDKITERILGDAQAEADRILAQAQADCKRISAHYAAQADEIREKLSRQAEQKGLDLVARAKSASAMQKRNLLLQQQSDLIDGVFSGAREWVLALDCDRYTELLAGLLASALFDLADTELKNRALYGDSEEESDAAYEVLLNKKDRERCGTAVLEGARKKLAGKLPQEALDRLVLSSAAAPVDGGVILRWGDVECNCSFGLLFAQLRRELETEVSRVLFESKGQN